MDTVPEAHQQISFRLPLVNVSKQTFLLSLFLFVVVVIRHLIFFAFFFHFILFIFFHLTNIFIFWEVGGTEEQMNFPNRGV